MKKYILFTNTKDKYHAHSLEFNTFYDLEEHLKKEFYFEEWGVDELVQDYCEFVKDYQDDTIFEFTIKDFILNVFNLCNCREFDVDIFNDFCKKRLVLISTFTDERHSMIISKIDYEKVDFMIDVYNTLFGFHGGTTTPIGAVNEFEVAVIDDTFENQVELEELDLPF